MRVGVIIGRFQVPRLHGGHLCLLDSTSRECEKVVVLVGVSPVDGFTSENPFSYMQREVTIQEAASNLNLTVSVMPLLDQRSDEDWSRSLDTLLDSLFPGAEVSLYHGRDSGFVKQYKGRYSLVSMEGPNGISGRQIRARIQESTHEQFMQGQAYALLHQYPHAYPTVDMAVVRYSLGERLLESPVVLLIRRADTGVWCFPGGFVDPTDASLECAALRETYEELGLSFNGNPVYIGSYLQSDWRYRGSRDKVITSFFRLDYGQGPVDFRESEVREYRWVDVREAHNVVSDVHATLANALFGHLKKV